MVWAYKKKRIPCLNLFKIGSFFKLTQPQFGNHHNLPISNLDDTFAPLFRVLLSPYECTANVEQLDVALHYHGSNRIPGRLAHTLKIQELCFRCQKSEKKNEDAIFAKHTVGSSQLLWSKIHRRLSNESASKTEAKQISMTR